LGFLSFESTNQLVASKHTPQDELADDEVLSVIKRLSKQRLDSIQQYTKAGRDDSAAAEQAEPVLWADSLLSCPSPMAVKRM